MTQINNNELEAARKLLGNPVDIGFDENALKVRRNLFIFSSITVYLHLTNIEVGSTLTLTGFELKGFNEANLYLGLLFINLYHLSHFSWYAFEAFYEWRLRITGSRALSTLAFENRPIDHPTDPRQATLYSWWINRANKLSDTFKVLDDHISWNLKMKNALENGEFKNINSWYSLEQYKIIDDSIQSVLSGYQKLADTINDPRITLSLYRFDEWNKTFWNSQNFRWITIECGLPLALGFSSVVISLDKKYPSIWPEIIDWLNWMWLIFESTKDYILSAW
jgi:hypothetical protein